MFATAWRQGAAETPPRHEAIELQIPVDRHPYSTSVTCQPDAGKKSSVQGMIDVLACDKLHIGALIPVMHVTIACEYDRRSVENEKIEQHM
jgi:hypothetical protein